MNCDKCNCKLSGYMNYCPNCGKRINNEVILASDIDRSFENKRVASIVLGIISLLGVSILIFAPVSFILSFIGLILAIIVNKNVRNSAGIILNAISLFLSAIICIFFVLFIFFSYNIIDNKWDKNVEIQDYFYGDF